MNRDLAYYSKVGFERAYSWREEDLSNFLIWDFIQVMNEMSYDSIEDVVNYSFETAAQKYKKYRFPLNLIDAIYNILLFFRFRNDSKKIKEKILFEVVGKYSPVVLAADKNYQIKMIVRGKKDRFFAIKNFIKYKSYSGLNKFVFNYLKTKNKQHLYDLIDRIKEGIKKIKPDYIVLWNDSLPIERAIVLAAKELKIPTIVIQHGIYQENAIIFDGRMADYVLVLGQYFKDLYVERGLKKPENVYILGYPYQIKREDPLAKNHNHCTVCYIGQDFEKYDKDLLDVKITTVKAVSKICQNLGLSFVYRPHPGDDRPFLKNKIPGISFTPRRESPAQTLQKADIFIAVHSTLLIEAAMSSKIALQLRNYPIKLDNFEEMDICSKSLTTVEELGNYLRRIAVSKNLSEFKKEFNNNYIANNYEPGPRFLQILDQIRKKENERRN